MEALAYHDAGQAVAAFSLLNRAVQVTIAPGETALHARLFTPPREDEHWAIEDGIVAVFAGSTAVRQHPGFLLPTALEQADNAAIEKLAGQLGSDPNFARLRWRAEESSKITSQRSNR